MTTEQLIELLKKHPGLTVLQSADAEGNTYSATFDADIAYVDRNYDGGQTDEVWDETDLLDEHDPEDDDEFLAGFQRVLVIYPI